MRGTARLCPTVVTKLVRAEQAGHVVAPLCSLYLGPAHGAEDDSVFASAPAFELGLHGIFTACAVAMPVFAAAEANRVAALRACHLPFVHISANHVTVAVWLRTEAHERITFKRLLVLKVV